METIGDLCEIQGETTIEWKIKGFFPLSDEKNKKLTSPLFYFSGASWNIGLLPNGNTENSSEGCISLYFCRESNGRPITVEYSLSIKSFDGDTYECKTFTESRIFGKNDGFGWKEFIARSELLEKKSQLKASNDVSVICTMKVKEPNSVNGSLFIRQKKIIDNLKEIRKKAIKTDCTLKVEGQSIPAHRMILEKGSPVFAAMFAHDTKENRTGEVLIDDTEKSTIEFIIEYMYSGDTPRFATESVLPVYAAAEKYDMQEVKEMCLQFIKTKLSVDWVCDVIKFAELYNEEEINLCAREYFKENAREILKTEKWKTFAKENHDLSVELLSSVVVALLPE